MKAVTFASILALSLAGAACSEKAPAEPEAPAAPSESADAPQFNLRYPGSTSENTSASAAGDFNLRVPDASAQSDGLRLPDGVLRENALSDIPEVTAPPLPEEPSSTDPDDDIIRLD